MLKFEEYLQSCVGGGEEDGEAEYYDEEEGGEEYWLKSITSLTFNFHSNIIS